jgi:hypothetical protein
VSLPCLYFEYIPTVAFRGVGALQGFKLKATDRSPNGEGNMTWPRLMQGACIPGHAVTILRAEPPNFPEMAFSHVRGLQSTPPLRYRSRPSAAASTWSRSQLWPGLCHSAKMPRIVYTRLSYCTNGQASRPRPSSDNGARRARLTNGHRKLMVDVQRCQREPTVIQFFGPQSHELCQGIAESKVHAIESVDARRTPPLSDDDSPPPRLHSNGDSF